MLFVVRALLLRGATRRDRRRRSQPPSPPQLSRAPRQQLRAGTAPTTAAAPPASPAPALTTSAAAAASTDGPSPPPPHPSPPPAPPALTAGPTRRARALRAPHPPLAGRTPCRRRRLGQAGALIGCSSTPQRLHERATRALPRRSPAPRRRAADCRMVSRCVRKERKLPPPPPPAPVIAHPVQPRISCVPSAQLTERPRTLSALSLRTSSWCTRTTAAASCAPCTPSPAQKWL